MEMCWVFYSYCYIQEVVYIDNNVFQCLFLEYESLFDIFFELGKILKDGYCVWLILYNDLGIICYMVVMGMVYYVVMIDFVFFIDVIFYSLW